MAGKRMFSKSITDSDSFQDMPLSAQCLYFHFCMAADDDGFLSSPNRIKRSIGANDSDIETLINAGFIIRFDSGIFVIRHWKLNNTIQKDRYNPTIYSSEYSMLSVKDGVYSVKNVSDSMLDTECIHNVSNMDTQIRLDKIRLDKYSVDIVQSSEGKIILDEAEKTFPPSLDDVQAYCRYKGYDRYDLIAERFYAYMSKDNWKNRRGELQTNWKAAMDSWALTPMNQVEKKKSWIEIAQDIETAAERKVIIDETIQKSDC